VVKLVHDECQINALHARMISPGFPQAIGAKVSHQPYFPANCGDEFPTLAAFYWTRIMVGFWIEKDIILRFLPNPQIGSQISFEGFPDALVDDHFLSFPSLLLLDPEALPDPTSVIQEMPNLQFEQIGDAQRRIDSHNKQQHVSLSFFSPQQIFDLGDLLPVADWLDIIYKSPPNFI
jgi:hypothetical protein